MVRSTSSACSSGVASGSTGKLARARDSSSPDAARSRGSRLARLTSAATLSRRLRCDIRLSLLPGGYVPLAFGCEAGQLGGAPLEPGELTKKPGKLHHFRCVRRTESSRESGQHYTAPGKETRARACSEAQRRSAALPDEGEVMTERLSGRTVAILATNGFEQSELEEPKRARPTQSAAAS